PLRPDTVGVKASGDAAVGQALRSESSLPWDDLLFAGIPHQPSAPTKVPAEWRVAANALATRPLHVRGAACPFPDHGPLQFGEDGSHLCHGSPVRTARVEIFGSSFGLDAFLVEVGNDGGGVGCGTKEPVQLRDDDDSFAFSYGGEELASSGT